MKKTYKNGSITLETAMVLPLFLFLVMNILSIFEMLYIHTELDMALNQAGRELSTYGVFQNLYENDILAQTYVHERVVELVGRSKIDASPIVGGNLGIVMWRTEIKNGVINLVMTYRVRPWFAFGSVGEMVLVNRCYIKAYTGYERDNTDERIYYVADTGEVYHLSPGCTHLELSISVIAKPQLETSRNMDGSRYKPCEICCDSDLEEEQIYIAAQGERYHYSLVCPGLKRTIYAVSESELNGLPPCQRCGKESMVYVGNH